MGIHIFRDETQTLRATVSGDFDLAAARELLLGIRREWRAGLGGVDVTLQGVTHATSCSIGTLALIAEMVDRKFRVSLDRCRDEVHGLFGAGLLDHIFPPELLAGCRGCLDREGRSCASA
ncbi:MAG: hypothetical protein H3C26_20580 [Rhodocyclaceae bacterium]|nr:hypothetical protein [Rhodocyclaceae bacterium]